MLVRSFAVTVFLFVALIVHVISYKEISDNSTVAKPYSFLPNEYGSSLWLALGALVLAAVDTVIVGFTVGRTV
uniref:Secreted protein n=1 Tax=Haemonchus contortus TaxID=6289 RepID=A0A7I4YG04_HAECO|nr:unnamed protein product [Haemonchus contortus]